MRLSLDTKYRQAAHFLASRANLLPGYSADDNELGKLAFRLREHAESGSQQWAMIIAPFHSSNIADKVIGPHADAADEGWLRNINEAASIVSNLIDQSTTVMIFRDHFPFASYFLNVSADNIRLYGEGLDAIKARHQLSHLQIVNWHSELSDPVAIESIFCSQFAEDIQKAKDELTRRINAQDPAVLARYTQQVKWFCEDRRYAREQEKMKLGKAAPANREYKRIDKADSINFIARVESLRKLCEQLFRNAFRLSVHPGKSLAPKIPYKLVPTMPGDVSRTPWQATPFLDRHYGLVVMTRPEAEKRGRLVTREGNPATDNALPWCYVPHDWTPAELNRCPRGEPVWEVKFPEPLR